MAVIVDAADPPRATLPAPTPGPRVAARRRRRWLTAVELLVAVAFVGVFAAVFARPAPAPLDAGHRWLSQAGPGLSAMALAVAHAEADPTNSADLDVLARATAKVRQVGPPPGHLAASEWQKALDYAGQAAADPAARGQLLNAAGLALVAVEVETRSG